MKTSRVVALIVGILLLVPGLGLLLGGGALGAVYAFGRDSSGYVQTSTTRLTTPTAAITLQDLAMTPAGTATPSWLVTTLDADIRLRVTSSSDLPVFVGIAPAADVNAYLRGTAHASITRLSGTSGSPGGAEYTTSSGTSAVAAPTAQTFWTVKATGPGTQELTWKVTDGSWAMVLMNADGSPAVTADASAGLRAGSVIPLALILLVAGAVGVAGAVALIVFGARGMRRAPRLPSGPAAGATAGSAVVADADAYSTGASLQGAKSPVALVAHLDANLSRWTWLVKWFLAIPHWIVLAFLWPVFAVLTVVAGVCILFTGRYPRTLFDINLGILQWSWRVSYYATNGGIGTDRYPPFTLGAVPDYPATLDIAYPQRLSRGLVLVKWLLAIPQLLIVGLLVGNTWSWTGSSDQGVFSVLAGGVLGVLVVIAGVVLLVKGLYPPRLFAVIVGFNRWIYRVVAYVALMTDQYPPFRLDQGGVEPISPQPPQTPRGPTTSLVKDPAPVVSSPKV